MPTDNPQGSSWPLPKFRFEVDFSSEVKAIPFQEVSGMDTETQVIDYRHHTDPAPIKMPNIGKIANITLKRGVFTNDNTFWNWYNQIRMNATARSTMLIRLLDENGHTTMTWTLNNAWVTKIAATDLKSDGNEVAVESVEVACEGVVFNR